MAKVNGPDDRVPLEDGASTTVHKSPVTLSKSGITLPDGREIEWESAAPGRYFLAECDDTQPMVCVACRVTESPKSLFREVDLAIQLAEKDGHTITAMYLIPAESVKNYRNSKKTGISQLRRDIRDRRMGVLYVHRRRVVTGDLNIWVSFVMDLYKSGVDLRFTSPDEVPMWRGDNIKFTDVVLNDPDPAVVRQLRARDRVAARRYGKS